MNKAMQSLVNAQVSVNRAVFEINSSNNPNVRERAPRLDYLEECVADAMWDLADAWRELKDLKKRKLALLAKKAPKKGDLRR